MNQMRGLDVTFAVHPRPAPHDSKDNTDPVPVPTQPSSVASLAEDAVPERDTFIGDLIFLARFAFGRY
jgi:hypothetical protein